MLGTLVGVAVGLAVAVFLKALDYSIAVTGQFPYYFLLLPLALLVSGAMMKYLAPGDEGHGTAMIIDALHKRSGKIKPSTVLVRLAATLITIASGGSAGKEEPGAQIGAGLSSLFSDLLKFDDRDRRKLVICGVSAGFASVFGTPIGGAIFGVEVLFVGGLMYQRTSPGVHRRNRQLPGVGCPWHHLLLQPPQVRARLQRVLLGASDCCRHLLWDCRAPSH